mmetsp:Transcript_35910/g.57320  ORF Transcript_35910/g.57320 Transcript_35910/m.57320 type:complete len:89 (-) Transcript_35910:1859-2125(-)
MWRAGSEGEDVLDREYGVYMGRALEAMGRCAKDEYSERGVQKEACAMLGLKSSDRHNVSEGCVVVLSRARCYDRRFIIVLFYNLNCIL